MDTANSKLEKIYFENLDALRFLAFFGVFLHHMFYTQDPVLAVSPVLVSLDHFFSNGQLGVNFFFVLSGFLITYLLFAEEARDSKINVLSFYARRTLRIWPLYYACLIFAFFLAPPLYQWMARPLDETANSWMYFVFLANFDSIQNGIPTTPPLSVLWSVAIEEQFYLLWPLLLTVITGKPGRISLFFAIILTSLVFTAINLNQGEFYLSKHTLPAISDMAVGALLAFVCFFQKKIIQRIFLAKKWQILLCYALGICLILFQVTLFNHPFLFTFKRFVFSLFFAFIIAEQVFCRNSLFKVGRLRFLTYWGNRSYGLYCLHYLAIFLVLQITIPLEINRTLFGVCFIEPVAAMFLSLAIAWFSFRFFEQPFLKLKARTSLSKSG